MTHHKQILTADECLAIASDAFRPSGADRFGLECEWQTFDDRINDRRPTRQSLQRLVGTSLPGRSHVTIEPGGQIELSTRAEPTVSAALNAVLLDEADMSQSLSQLGVSVVCSAVDTTRSPRVILDAGRYNAMSSYWTATDGIGPWMMCNTSSLQVNVSNDASDPARRWVVSNMIGPLLIAIFANSGGIDARGNRWESLRQGIWSAMEPRHTRAVPLEVNPAESWLAYALEADVFYVPETDGCPGASLPPGLSFGSWMRTGASFGWPTHEDFRYHLTTLFPPVRPKGWLEFRMIDALPPAARAAAALTVAVATCTLAATDILREISLTGLDWTAAARLGMRDPQMRAAATTLMSIVLRHVEELDVDRQHVALLEEFILRYTLAGRSPSFDTELHLPINLERQTLETRTGSINRNAYTDQPSLVIP